MIDEIFTLHHLDLGLSEEEINDLLEESTIEDRVNWIKKTGYEINHD